VASIVITETASAEIVDALVNTEKQHGPGQRKDCENLIREALDDLSMFPGLGTARPEIHADARTFPIARRGHHARHILIYRIAHDGTVEIARCVHDAMKLELMSDWQR